MHATVNRLYDECVQVECCEYNSYKRAHSIARVHPSITHDKNKKAKIFGENKISTLIKIHSNFANRKPTFDIIFVYEIIKFNLFKFQMVSDRIYDL